MSHSPLTSSPTRLRAALSKRKTTGPYARSSAAADISRMLDPAYAAKSARRVSAPVMPVHAYVDQSGELHDPDFRDFPLSLNSRRRMSDEAERPGSSTAVPSWERAGMAYSGYGYRSGLNTYDSSVRTSLERYTPQGGQYAYVPSAWSSSPASASSDERPLGDRNMGFASTLDAQVDEHGVPRTPSLSGSWLPSSHSGRSTRRRRSSKKLRKTHVDDYVQEDADTSYSPPLPESFAAALAEPLYFPDQAYVEEPKELPKDEDVPSCSYILRKKYLAIQLRIRFGVHNAKRQIKRRLGRAVVE